MILSFCLCRHPGIEINRQRLVDVNQFKIVPLAKIDNPYGSLNRPNLKGTSLWIGISYRTSHTLPPGLHSH
jgi:hypothetical protein